MNARATDTVPDPLALLDHIDRRLRWLSCLGMFGVSEIVPVLNPPQGMILGVGADERKPVVQGDGIVVGTMLRAVGSFDHRAIDGAGAARLMQALRSVMETPLQLLA